MHPLMVLKTQWYSIFTKRNQCIAADMANLLYLPDWTVTSSSIDERGAYQIAASFDLPPEHCLTCGPQGRLVLRGARPYRIVDAPVHGRPVFISVRRIRYFCRNCGGSFMQPLPDVHPDNRMTLRCVDYIQRQSLLKPTAHVSEDTGVQEGQVREIADAHAERLSRKHAKALRAPRVLGIDEINLAGELRAIIVDILDEGWPIELLPSRTKRSVNHFLANLAGRREVEVVTMDMWGPYRSAVRRAMPQAVIIVDKWHIQNKANNGMDEIRRRLQRALANKHRHDPSFSDRKRLTLKSINRLFLKRWNALSAEEQLDLSGWLRNEPKLQDAYYAKEAFFKIWDQHSRAEAKTALDEWRWLIPKHIRTAFKPALTAAKNWEDEILNYFDHGRHTNAPTETRNRDIRRIYDYGSGYSFEAIRARALFGRRPDRTKVSNLPTRAYQLGAFGICSCCKGLFEPTHFGMAANHITNGKPRTTSTEVICLCDYCSGYDAGKWF